MDTVRRNDLLYPVETRYVRMIGNDNTGSLSYRCEFYGCPIPKDGVLPTLIPSVSPTSSTSPTVSTGL